MNALSRLNYLLAKVGLYFSIAGLFTLIIVVAYQVFGRYVLNDSPTWTETLALVLILYVTLIGAAIGVRENAHSGMELLLEILPDRVRHIASLLIYLLVTIFGIAMVYNGWVLGASVANYKIANLNTSEAVRYIPLVLSGLLIVLFSVEQIFTQLANHSKAP